MTNFQIYKAEINRLLEKTQTGGGWEVTIELDSKDESRFANVYWDTGGRNVVFGFNEKTNA